MGTPRTMLVVPRGPTPLRRRVGWTRTMQEIVLDELAATADLAKAAESVGLEEIDICALRRRDARFAAAFTEAFALGVEVLQMRLLALTLAEPMPDASAADRAKRIDGAVKLLAAHREGCKARAADAPAADAYAKREATDKVILDQLDVIEKRRASERPEPDGTESGGTESDGAGIHAEGKDERIDGIHRRDARPAGGDDPSRAGGSVAEDDPGNAGRVRDPLGTMGAPRAVYATG